MRRTFLVTLGVFVGVCSGSFGLGQTSAIYNSVYFVDAQTGYLAGGDRFLRSTDGGETWAPFTGPGAPEGVENMNIVGPRFRGSSLGWFKDLNTDRVFVTTDGGRTWGPRSLTITLAPGITTMVGLAEFVSPTEAWGGGHDGAYHSSDGGRTWNLLRVPNAFPTEPFGMTFLDPVTGWVLGREGIRATTDGGRTWGAALGKPPVAPQSEGFRFLSTAVGWILGDDDRLYRTTDGGRSWMASSLPPGVRKILRFSFLDPNLGWASGQRGVVLKTTDGGTTWALLPTRTIADLYGVHFVTAQLGFAVGNFNMILKTTDGGQTWKQVSDGEIIVDPSGRPSP